MTRSVQYTKAEKRLLAQLEKCTVGSLAATIIELHRGIADLEADLKKTGYHWVKGKRVSGLAIYVLHYGKHPSGFGSVWDQRGEAPDQRYAAIAYNNNIMRFKSLTAAKAHCWANRPLR